MIEFERHKPDNIPEICKEWLISATKRTGISYLDAEDYFKSCLTKEIHIYSVEKDGVLTGCLCLTFREVKNHRIMNLVLMGGKDIKSWRNELVEFLFATAKYYSCTEFTMMGPLAWKRLFPELNLLSCVFGRNLT